MSIELALLFIWQKVSMQIRLLVTVCQMHHPVYENIGYNATVQFLKSSSFQARRLLMLLAESTLKMKWEMGLDFTIHEVTQCMTPIQM